jgi:enoyl-CoA hydratase/carnithine racemase
MSAERDPGLPTLAIADGVATVCLHRPDHMNRLHREDLLALQAIGAKITADLGLRAVVLRSEGRVFCSGAHLGEFGAAQAGGQAAEEPALSVPQLFEQTVDAWARVPVPVVCRLQGGVYGGATDLALACDFRIGVRGMALRMPAARIGLHYYPSGLRRYTSRLGLAAAKRLFLLAETVPDEQLLALGFLDELAADAAALDARVEAFVAALAQGAPLAMRGMKRSLDDCAEGLADLAVIREREALCAASADLREGLAAVRDKRAPRFEGR